MKRRGEQVQGSRGGEYSLPTGVTGDSGGKGARGGGEGVRGTKEQQVTAGKSSTHA